MTILNLYLGYYFFKATDVSVSSFSKFYFMSIYERDINGGYSRDAKV